MNKCSIYSDRGVFVQCGISQSCVTEMGVQDMQNLCFSDGKSLCVSLLFRTKASTHEVCLTFFFFLHFPPVSIAAFLPLPECSFRFYFSAFVRKAEINVKCFSGCSHLQQCHGYNTQIHDRILVARLRGKAALWLTTSCFSWVPGKKWFGKFAMLRV